MTKKIHVSIIIANNSRYPNYKRFVSRCIRSIKNNTFTLYEILVVDGAITGPAIARNSAAKRSRGKYLLFLDYDTTTNSTALHSVIEYLDKNPTVGGGQLKLLRMDRKNIFDSAGDKLTPFGFLAERGQESKDKGQFNKVEPIFSGKGAAMIVRKDVFNKIGGFDEDYFMYWEEPDLAWRIWKAEYKFVFIPMGVVYHAYGSNEKIVSNEWDIQITYLGCKNQIMTIIKNGVGLNGLIMLFFVTLAWVGLFFLFLLQANLKKATSIVKAFIWLVSNHKLIRQKRESLKIRLGERFKKDSEWFSAITLTKGINWYIGKGSSYLLGRQ
jgi:GT2 family glycosyltransferase